MANSNTLPNLVKQMKNLQNEVQELRTALEEAVARAEGAVLFAHEHLSRKTANGTGQKNMPSSVKKFTPFSGRAGIPSEGRPIISESNRNARMNALNVAIQRLATYESKVRSNNKAVENARGARDAARAAQRALEKTRDKEAELAKKIAKEAANAAEKAAANAKAVAKAAAASAEMNRQRAALYNNKNRREFNRRLAEIREIRSHLATHQKTGPTYRGSNYQLRLKNAIINMKKFVNASMTKAAQPRVLGGSRILGGGGIETLNQRRARLRRESERATKVNSLVKKFVNKLKSKRRATLNNQRQANASLNNILNNLETNTIQRPLFRLPKNKLKRN